MRQYLVLAAVLLIAVSPVAAQRASDVFGGDLPQEYGNDINNKFDLMRVDEMLNDPAMLEQFYSAEQLATFFEQAVVKISFYPDGSYVAYARQGGDLTGLKLGRKKVALENNAWESGAWRLRAGQFTQSKRATPVTLRLAAAGNEASVECMNKLQHSDETVTFYVGPMNGLRCVGLVDDEALPFDEVVRTADGDASRLVASPGS